MDIPRILATFALSAAAVWLLVGCTPGSDGAVAAVALQTNAEVTVAGAMPTSTEEALQPFEPTATLSPTAVVTLVPPTLPTAIPTITRLPTATSTVPPTATSLPTETPLPTLDPYALVNGLTFDEIAVISPEAAAHARLIYQRGQEIGRNPNAFSKLGDSLVLTGHYLTRFDNNAYELGQYGMLEPIVAQFQGSFSRYGVATAVGLHALNATTPGLANGEACQAVEHMLECEFRHHNPSVLLVRTGTNDTGTGSAFETAVRQIIDYSIANGVIPVLGTKADRFEGDDRNNEIIRKLAAEYRLPLWDFDRLAATMPGHGLSGDDVHLTVYKHDDYTDPETFTYGYPMSDLSALIVLDAIHTAIAGQ